jgi:hypothetical protein
LTFCSRDESSLAFVALESACKNEMSFQSEVWTERRRADLS